jgi:phosphotransferase system  glucose/maltose/N-acetylglucosamine-specific IIC component
MASRDIKAQAQSLFVLFTQGIGTFIGSLISGLLYNSTMASSYSVQYQWTLFWSIPTIIALLVTVFFVFAFRMKNEEYEKTDIHVVQK